MIHLVRRTVPFGVLSALLLMVSACGGSGAGPTPDQVTVPTPDQVAVPTSAQVAVPASTQVAVPTPTQLAVPAPAQVAVPTSAQVAVPTPAQVAVPAPTQMAVPAPAQVAVPTPAQVAVPTPAQVAVPAPAQVAVPAPSQVTPPTPGQVTLSKAVGPLALAGTVDAQGRSVVDVRVDARVDGVLAKAGQVAPTGISFNMSYDPAQLRYVGVTHQYLSQGVGHYQIDRRSGTTATLAVTVETGAALTGSPVLLRLAFERVGPGDTDIAVTHAKLTSITPN